MTSESIPELEIVRFDQNDYRTLGKFMIQGDLWGYTLELPWRDNQRLISCIPTGEYEFIIYYSEKYKRLCIAILNVPNRDYISIHHGNTTRDTKGCILPGMSANVNSISSSSVALRLLVQSYPEGGKLIIT